MSGIGPELPPHLLAKRKRMQGEDVEDTPATASGAKQASNLGEGEKRRRIMGPAMPPASLDEKPQDCPEPPEEVEPDDDGDDNDGDDDGDFCPTLPTTSPGKVDEIVNILRSYALTDNLLLVRE